LGVVHCVKRVWAAKKRFVKKDSSGARMLGEVKETLN